MSALDKAAKAELESASSISHWGIIILLFRRGRPFCLSLIVGVCACACGRPGGVCVNLRYKKAFVRVFGEECAGSHKQECSAFSSRLNQPPVSTCTLSQPGTHHAFLFSPLLSILISHVLVSLSLSYALRLFFFFLVILYLNCRLPAL